MKNRIRYIVALLISLVIVIISINLFQTNKDQKARGDISILAKDSSYDYLVECANNFMKLNDKATIRVSKLDDYNKISEIIRESNKLTLGNIAQINRYEFENLEYHDLENYDEETQLINTYNKNFSKHRLNEVKYKDKVIGIPLNSRPLALYIREDILKKYGYSREEMNTWKDIIHIGKDIYEKSNKEVRIINATGQDYEDLLDLLTMQVLDEEKSEYDIKKEVQKRFEELKDNNILNLDGGGEFLARISSINAMREIMTIEEHCEWSVGTVPSIEAGINKFFASEGDNIIILNQNYENKRLIENFITYIITNNKETIKYVKEGKFFSSYLYTYKRKEIEDSVNNFVGQSPLVVLSNIEEKTLPISDYDKYIKVKRELRM